VYEKKFDQADIIIRQTSDADNFYILTEGECDILIDGVVVNTYEALDYFGELALLNECPRTASIVARNSVTVLVLDKVRFNELLAESIRQKRESYQSFLTNVPIFASASSYQLLRLADALVEVSFHDKHTIIREGDQPDHFYILIEGHPRATRIVAGQKKSLEVFRYEDVGSYFGEYAFLGKTTRQASILAEGPVKCADFDDVAFHRLINVGAIAETLASNLANYSQADNAVDDQRI